MTVAQLIDKLSILQGHYEVHFVMTDDHVFLRANGYCVVSDVVLQLQQNGQQFPIALV